MDAGDYFLSIGAIGIGLITIFNPITVPLWMYGIGFLLFGVYIFAITKVHEIEMKEKKKMDGE